MSRRTITLVLALALMALVMIVAVLIYVTGPPRERWTIEQRWGKNLSDTETVKGINMAGDKIDEIFAQSPSQVLILDTAGQTLFELPLYNGKTTMGDLNGDELDDFVALHQPGGESTVAEAFTAAGVQLWARALPGFGQPSRATSADLTGDGVREIVSGDDMGQLVLLSNDGQVLWTFSLPSAPSDSAYVRGLDEVSLGNGRNMIAAANYQGDVVLLDADGKELWSLRFPEQLRRLRAYDLDGDGVAEVILGGERGRVEALDAASGQRLWSASAGSRVTEMRDVQLDDDLGTMEVVVGTRAGTLLGFDAQGTEIFRASLGSRVEAIAGKDLDGDGHHEVLAGSETGTLGLFRADGTRLETKSPSGEAIVNIDAGKRLDEGEFILGTNRAVSLQGVGVEAAPIWYNPLLAGLLACLVIAGAAWALSGVQRPPRLEYSAEELTVEALQAKRRMLKESLAEVRRLQESGEVPPDAYTARTRELRAHIARVEAELIKQGVKITSEVMQCPHCGGALELGVDRCEYCGQTVV